MGVVLEPSCVAVEGFDQSDVVGAVLEQSHEGGVVRSNVGVVHAVGVCLEVACSERQHHGLGAVQYHEVGVV